MKKKTEKEFYDRFEKMVNEIGLAYSDPTPFGTKERLTEMFKEDEHLNQIPLSHLDMFHPYFFYKTKDGPKSLSDTTCMIKHALIYHFLGVEPVFYGKNRIDLTLGILDAEWENLKNLSTQEIVDYLMGLGISEKDSKKAILSKGIGNEKENNL